MNKKTFQHISGYVIGGTIFLIIIPRGLFQLSSSFDQLTGIHLIAIPGLRLILAIILLLFGLLFAIWSIVIQNIVGKGGPLEGLNIEVSPKTQNLVVSGPYRYTRNPMLFGTCLFYYAVAVYLDSIVAIAIVTLFMIFMLIFIMLTEERRLLKEFGRDYEEYRQKVPMFIPFKRKKSTS